jgi:hypothetical protein
MDRTIKFSERNNNYVQERRVLECLDQNSNLRMPEDSRLSDFGFRKIHQLSRSVDRDEDIIEVNAIIEHSGTDLCHKSDQNRLTTNKLNNTVKIDNKLRDRRYYAFSRQ